MTKTEVLSILKNQEGYISGQAISRSLSISRAAVHTAVEALRADGYGIEAVTNRGYRLLSAPNVLDTGALTAELGSVRMERVICLPTVDSTNAYLLALSHSAPDGQAVIANEQTQGRGRIGRSFSSPKDKGIYLSYLIRPRENETASVADWLSLTAWTSAAVSDAVFSVSGRMPQIKWVNDLLLDGKKICGILTQTDLETETGMIRGMVIGIGINVLEEQSDFPEELQKTAGSLLLSGCPCSRAALAAAVVRSLDEMRDAYPSANDIWLQKYRERCCVPGRKITVIEGGKSSEAAAIGIDDRFGLIIEENGKERILRSGEISVRL